MWVCLGLWLLVGALSMKAACVEPQPFLYKLVFVSFFFHVVYAECFCSQRFASGQEPSKIVRGPVFEPHSGESPLVDPWLLALRNDAYWASPGSGFPSLRAVLAPPGVKR